MRPSLRNLLLAACVWIVACHPTAAHSPADAGGATDAGPLHAPDGGPRQPDGGTPDAGLLPDAGQPPDAGFMVGEDAGPDSGTEDDAGPSEDGGPVPDAGADAGIVDAGPPDAGGTLGWTTFPGLPGSDGGYAVAIYVDSASGSDSNDGSSPAQALQHVDASSKLYKLLSTAASPASMVVLLKPGSHWTYEQMEIPVGGSAAYPLWISGSEWPNAGSTSRPTIGEGIRVIASGVDHVVLEGLAIGPFPSSFPADAGSKPSSIGVEINRPGGTDYLIEDCLITDYYDLVQVSGSHTSPLTNFRLRRSYLFGAYGSGPAVAFGGEDVVGEEIDDNFFDYNGGPDGGYLDPSIRAPYTNIFAHDVYFADDGTSVIALSVNFRRNLFSRTLESMKGAYSGTVDDNLFYEYSSGGFVGPWGSNFTNNVLINGGGFQAALDNSHDPNTDAGAITTFCNNLEYNQPAPLFTVPYEGAFQAMNQPNATAVGVNLRFTNNVIDGFSQAFLLNDPGCFGYVFDGNTVSASKLWDITGAWPIAGCPLEVAANAYYMPNGEDSAVSTAYALELDPPSGTRTYDAFAGMEAFVHEDGGSFSAQPFAFTSPSNDIGGYLVSAGFAPTTASPTLTDYLDLVRSQANAIHQWNDALSVHAINAFIRPGHSLQGKPFGYQVSCP